MLEKEIEAKVVAYAKTKNYIVYKFASPSNRSVPDRIFITPNGKVKFIEFKRKGKVPVAAIGRSNPNDYQTPHVTYG